MGEAPSLLAFITREIGTVHARHVGGGGDAGQTTSRVVRGPGKLVVSSPELVEFQSEFRAAGVGSLR